MQTAAALTFALSAAALSTGKTIWVAPFVYLLTGSVLLNPRAPFAIFVTCIALLAAFLSKRHLTNHDTLILSVLATVLSSYLYAVWRARRFAVDLGIFHRCLGAVMRVEFLVFYAWVGVHKLNAHYFDPSLSCANNFLGQWIDALPGVPVPAWVPPISSYLTVGAEIATLVMLLIRPLRKFGILVGVAFHSILVVLYPAFQFLVFGFFILFIPEETLERVRQSLVGGRFLRGPRDACLSLLRRSGWFRAGIGIVLLMALRFSLAEESVRAVVCVALLVSAITAYTVTLFAVELRHPAPPVRICAGLPAVLAILPIFVFFQGLQPHLGFKAVQSFSMFSNLDTQAGQSNHLFLPVALQVSDNLSETVEVHGTNLVTLAKVAKSAGRHSKVSYAHMRQLISRASRAGAKGLRVSFTHRGVPRTVERAEEDPELSSASWVERVYLQHGLIATSRHGRCRW
jgi:hypothetical protein